MYENAFNQIERELRNEAGIANELDYVEQISWVLFLKYLHDLEVERRDRAELSGEGYTPLIDPDFEWGDWAAPRTADGKFDHNEALVGDDLIGFVDRDLFPYLASFRQSAAGPRTIDYKIGEIFTELRNKFRSGYILRDVLEIVDGLSFNTQAQRHELSELYESRIRRMGNAGRNGGEYYTPRPLIRAMIKVVDPQIGETVYDGAVGSAGFLCEAWEHIRRPDLSGLRLRDPAERDVLRAGEKVARLHYRHHEHDPARDRGAEHRPHQLAQRERDGLPGARPPRHRARQSPLRRRRAARGPAQLPDPLGRDRLSLPPTLYP